MVQKDDSVNLTFKVLLRSHRHKSCYQCIRECPKTKKLKEILPIAKEIVATYMDSERIPNCNNITISTELSCTKTQIINLDSYESEELEKTLGDIYQIKNAPEDVHFPYVIIEIKNEEIENYEPQLSSSERSVFNEKHRVPSTDIQDFGASETQKNMNSLDIDRLGGMKHLMDRPSKPNYVGLVNQAMTCYLNSLLQALYMTPEFRNALYNWEYKGSEGSQKTSLPYELQKLFLNLQTSSRHAVETTSLTKSFGWDFNEAWQQHDIQELCRVMFDALEQNFKNTAQADLINKLYEGKINDYVKCLTCNTEKSREDTFLDIPLPVRIFDHDEAHGSVEEALAAFVKYETLEGNNQYFCEKCNKKSNAHKGLKFTKFPYILTLQLKRFDFDPKVYNRIKLNDRVTFPNELNLNSLIVSATNQESPSREEDAGMSIKSDDITTDRMVDEEASKDTGVSNSNHVSYHDQDDDEGIDMTNGMSSSSSSNHNIEKLREEYASAKGPYIYDLFSIMIHSGSANGGHYYAYIKDFRTDKWLCFNDQNVNPIGHEDIERTYGGGNRSYLPGMYRSSTNAYMLMYRQIDPQRNALPMEKEQFPPHIKELLEKMHSEKKAEETRHYREEYTCIRENKTIYYHYPGMKTIHQVTVSVGMNDTLAELTRNVYKEAGISKIADLDQCRIVSYKPKYNIVCSTFEDRDEVKLKALLARSRYLHHVDSEDAFYYREFLSTDFMLDIREKIKPFDDYPPKPIVTKVYILDHSTCELLDGPHYVRAYDNETFYEYKQELQKQFKLDADELFLMVEVNCRQYAILDDKDEDPVFKSSYKQPEVHTIIATEISQYDSAVRLKFYESNHTIMNNLRPVVCFHLHWNISAEDLTKLNIPFLKPYNIDQESVTEYNCMKDDMMNLKIVKSDKSHCNNRSEMELQRHVVEDEISEKEDWNWNIQETSNSEDSSLSDSDRTLVGDEPEDPERDCESSPHIHKRIRRLNIIKPESCNAKGVSYFKITDSWRPNTFKIVMRPEKSLYNMNRILEEYINIPRKYFKIVNVDENCTRGTVQNDAVYTIKLGRIILKDEIRVVIYHIRMDSVECLQELCTTIIKRGTSSQIVQNKILTELKQNTNIDIPYDDCVFLIGNKEYQKLRPYTDQNMNLISYDNETVCIYVLSDVNRGCEKKKFYVRKWNPTQNRLDNPQEMTVDKNNCEEKLREKISQESSIPLEYLKYSFLHASNQISSDIENLNDSYQWVSCFHCNSIHPNTYLVYRDNKESMPMKKMSQQKSINGPMNYSSPRREKGLKINYT